MERWEMLRTWQEVPSTPPPSAVTRSELKQTEQRLLLLLPCSRPVLEGAAHSRTSHACCARATHCQVSPSRLLHHFCLSWEKGMAETLCGPISHI